LREYPRFPTRRSSDLSKLQAYTRDREESRVIPVWDHERYAVPAYDDGGVIGSKIALFGSKPTAALDLIGNIERTENLPHPQLNGDRKSTRLNSSHVKI